ncbi:MAG: hypothetical protein NT069_22455 [Planctomycetota bacterium]|nr:hypothetical protein [Planctomycetota bacterium]
MTHERFESAAARHFDDAVFLLHRGRHDNAAYLAGYVAECALKLLVSHESLSVKKLGHDVEALSVDAIKLLWVLNPSQSKYVVDVLHPNVRKGAHSVKHFGDARLDLLTELRDVGPEVARICAIFDLNGRSRILAEPAAGQDPKMVSQSLQNRFSRAADAFWTNEVWIQDESTTPSRREVY